MSGLGDRHRRDQRVALGAGARNLRGRGDHGMAGSRSHGVVALGRKARGLGSRSGVGGFLGRRRSVAGTGGSWAAGRSGTRGSGFSTRAVAGEVMRLVGSSAGVLSAAGYIMTGRSTATAAVQELADFAGTGDIPDHAGLIPLVDGGRGSAALQISFSCCHASKGRKDEWDAEGLHFAGFFGMTISSMYIRK